MNHNQTFRQQCYSCYEWNSKNFIGNIFIEKRTPLWDKKCTKHIKALCIRIVWTIINASKICANTRLHIKKRNRPTKKRGQMAHSFPPFFNNCYEASIIVLSENVWKIHLEQAMKARLAILKQPDAIKIVNSATKLAISTLQKTSTARGTTFIKITAATCLKKILLGTDPAKRTDMLRHSTEVKGKD